MKKLIWFDFENAPHAWVFKEIIHELEKEYEILITIRDFSSTKGICDYLGLTYVVVGKSFSSSSNLGKLMSIVKRALSLRKFMLKNKMKPSLAVSHGSRSQALASFLLKVPQIFLEDYEHAYNGFHKIVDKILSPFPIRKEAWGKNLDKVVSYPGLKEELYLWQKENYFIDNLEVIDKGRINILFRPEGYNTHYASPKSKILQDNLIDFFSKQENINVILIARDKTQEKQIITDFNTKKISYRIPSGTLNGPALIANCDAVIGGGGTMTREACTLRVPSYSFFGGTQGDVDKFLVEKKLLVYLEEVSDIEKIKLDKLSKESDRQISKEAFNFVIKVIKDILK